MKDITELDNKENMMSEGDKKNWNIKQVSTLEKEKILLPLLKKKKKQEQYKKSKQWNRKDKSGKSEAGLKMPTDYLLLPPSLEQLPPAIFNLY